MISKTLQYSSLLRTLRGTFLDVTKTRTVSPLSYTYLVVRRKCIFVPNNFNINSSTVPDLNKRNYSTTSSAKCWNCQKKIDKKLDGIFFCCRCGCIQEMNKNYDYFELLGQKRRFAIDTENLTKQFRQRQSILHPDKFSQKSKHEQNLSANWSSLINKAYKTLLKPIDRAVYILEQNNVQISEDNTSVDKEFLLEMMEKNEEVENAQTSEALQKLLKKCREELDVVVVELIECLQKTNFEEAKKKVITMRYLISLENSIKDKNSKLIEKL